MDVDLLVFYLLFSKLFRRIDVLGGYFRGMPEKLEFLQCFDIYEGSEMLGFNGLINL